MGIHCIYINKYRCTFKHRQEPATAPVEKEAAAKAVAPAVVLPMAIGRKVKWMQWVLVANSWRMEQPASPLCFCMAVSVSGGGS